jgi:hypothetical protein
MKMKRQRLVASRQRSDVSVSKEPEQLAVHRFLCHTGGMTLASIGSWIGRKRTALFVLAVVVALLSCLDVVPPDRLDHLSPQEKAFMAQQREIEQRLEPKSKIQKSPDIVQSQNQY